MATNERVRPILVAVDPFREDRDPLSLAALLGELTGRRLVAIGAHPQSFLPGQVDVLCGVEQGTRFLRLAGPSGSSSAAITRDGETRSRRLVVDSAAERSHRFARNRGVSPGATP